MSNLMSRDNVEIVWLQQEEESDLWYRRFMSYYLPLGPSRNLTRAYVRWLETEKPEKAEEKKSAKGYINITKEWSAIARRWQWRERADAFDLYTAGENFAYVDKARELLLRSTEAAAQALVENLKNPRLAVSAAKEILDRGGLPGTHLVGVGHIEPYTADDLRKAEEDVNKWEKQIRGDAVIIDATSSSDSNS